jgi:hypothetical protein
MEEVKKKGKRKTIVSVMVGVCILLTSTAGATILGTANIQNHNNNHSDTARLRGDGLPVDNTYYYDGIYSWTNSGGTDLGTQVPNWGFCIELPQNATNGWSNVIPLEEAPLPPLFGTPMGSTKADYMRELWGRHFDSSWPTGGDKQGAEAFSIAVWEIIYEALPATPADWDVTSGWNSTLHTGFQTFAADADTVTANAWLRGLTGNSAYFAPNLVAISNGYGQDYLVQVPEPATLFLLAAGVAAVLRRRSR